MPRGTANMWPRHICQVDRLSNRRSRLALLHGDQIVVTRSKHHVRFLHPKGWSYFDTLRQKMHWNEGVVGEGTLKP